MKLKIELDEQLTEEEVIIRCNAIDEQVLLIQKSLTDLALRNQRFVFYKDDAEYYFSLEEILFFETEDKAIRAHTRDNMYQVRYRLYELEELLPGHFMRISKSTIINSNRVYSIKRNLTASSLIEFQNTHKQVFVSRHYYKPLKDKLEEKRVKS